MIHSAYLAANAHVVAVDPTTGRSYSPALSTPGSDRPALLICQVG
ncbi:MAG: hypothetical protein ACM3ML_36660 [Micromonosporaceae bacterium]